MTDFAHEEVLFFLAFLAFGNVRDGADDADGPSLAPVALEISLPEGLHPPDLTVSPPDPELGRGAMRFGGIERRVVGRPNPFRIVWMHPVHELFDSGLILGDAQNFLRACIPGEDTAGRILLSCPKPGCAGGKLQSRPAFPQLGLPFPQSILRPLSPPP